MKIRMNPIVKKDLKVASRSMRLSWGLFGYEVLLILALLLALLIIQSSAYSIYTDNNIYGYMVYIFPVLAVTQVCIVALIVPILTASSISGEKERQTFDIMMTTCMSPLAIVMGKVASAVIRILFYVAAGIPIMALSFVVGGVSWSTLFYFLLAIIMLSIFCGSVGILCSSFCRKSITAVIMSFGIYMIVFGATFLPLLFASILAFGVSGNSSAGESILILLFNPILFFEEFFMLVMTGSSLLGGEWGTHNFSRSEVGFFTYHLCQGKLWLIVSAICILGLSFLCMLLAAWKVNPMHAGKGRPPKKSKKK